jgi:hypothetical protein
MNTRHTLTVYSRTLRVVSFPLVLLFLLTLSPGCNPDKPALGKAALSLRDGLQATLNLYSAGLAEPMSQGDSKRVKAVLERMFSEAVGPANIPKFSVAVLDNHGTTVARTARSELSDVQNYGNYQVVSRVIQKRKASQSILYLHGSEKVFIVCAPLLHREKLAGILIISIDNDRLHQAGITDAEFMALTFPPHPGTS